MRDNPDSESINPGTDCHTEAKALLYRMYRTTILTVMISLIPLPYISSHNNYGLMCLSTLETRGIPKKSP